MKSNTQLTVMVLCTVIWGSPIIQVQAVPDRDLQINGHFRGTAQGFSPAPGWTLTADGGNARILPTHKNYKFMLELQAVPSRSQSVVSDLHPVYGNTIEISADLSGSGYATIGFEAFDQTGNQLVASDKQTCPLTQGQEQKFKRYFSVNSQAQYIRVRLTAERGSTAIFRDVEAEMKINPVPPQPGTIAAPPPATMAAPQPGTVAAPPPATVESSPSVPASKANARPSRRKTAARRMLQHHRYYTWSSLGPKEYFQVQLPVGSEIEFDLQENPAKNLYWNVISYDARICRIKLEHDRDGVFPFRVDKAEFELKALWRGTTTIVLSCGGKKITIDFTAL